MYYFTMIIVVNFEFIAIISYIEKFYFKSNLIGLIIIYDKRNIFTV